MAFVVDDEVAVAVAVTDDGDVNVAVVIAALAAFGGDVDNPV